jgi:DNA-binding transcriptional LysR family regulator
MFDWNDLRYLLGVARHGSTLAAAKALGVSQSTVHRRLAELERKVGRAVVERQATGYRLTDFGREILPHAERAEEAALAVERQRAAAGPEVVRVTCPEPIMVRLIQCGFVERFHARHPDLRVEFVMSDRYLDLARGDADVALRSGDTDGVLVGRKIADSVWAVYASRRYVEAHGAPAGVEGLDAHPLLGLEPGMANHRLSKWLTEVAPRAEIAARSNSVLGLVSAVKAGIGLAPLPIALGDAEPDLARVLGPIPALARSWRVLAHPDLRRSRRVAAFFDFVVAEIPALRPILTG